MTVVTWTKIPLIGLPEMSCQVDITEDGRTCDDAGEPLPVSERPFKCGADGYWMLGSVFLCKEHAREVAELMGDNIDDILEDWKALL